MVASILGFTVLGVSEVYSLHITAQWISFVNTISLVMFTFLLGGILGRSYGDEWLEKIQWHLRSRTVAPDDVLNGAVMVIGSMLLITPGTITDVLGLIVTFPKTRFLAIDLVRGLMRWKIARGENYFFFKD